MEKLSNEEIASRLVGIYFREVARLGYKRSLTLDETINAYYYALSKLGNKEKAMAKVRQEVIEDEQEMKAESKEELFPQVTETTTVTETKTTETKKEE